MAAKKKSGSSLKTMIGGIVILLAIAYGLNYYSGRMWGTYTCTGNIYNKLEFSIDKTVYITGLGIKGKGTYEVSQAKVFITNSVGSTVTFKKEGFSLSTHIPVVGKVTCSP